MKRGITLVSLVITIVIMLILAGVGIYGSLALIEEAKYSAFINEMKQLDESVAILILEKQIESAETGKEIQLFKDLADMSLLPESLQNEINYIREKLEGTVDITAEIPSDYSYTVETGEGKNIYYVDEQTAGGKVQAYIYDEQSASVYKVEPTIIWGVEMHGYEYGNLLTTQSGLLERAQSKQNSKININNLEEWNNFVENANLGETYLGKTVILNTNIDLEDSHTPIPLFEGTFEGNNYSINNININAETGSQALFVSNSGTIKNVTIKGEITANGEDVAGLTATNSGTIDNCINYINVTNNTTTQWDTGGIVGQNIGGSVTNCKNYGTITSNYRRVGGIIGCASKNEFIVENCENYGKITGSQNIGGIIGASFSKGKITSCINNNEIKTTEEFNAGGIIGSSTNEITIERCINKGKIETAISSSGGIIGAIQSKSTIYECKNEAEILANGGAVGGIVGYIGNNDHTEVYTTNIERCVNEGYIHSNGKNDIGAQTGGIVGCVESGYTAIIKDCYNTGDIEGSTTSTVAIHYGVGGICGLLGAVKNSAQVSSSITIENCYNTANITNNTNSANAGQILGNNHIGSNSTITNCYYLDTATGTNTHGGTAVSDTNLKTYASTLGENYWANDETGYPILKWQVETEE